MKILLSLSMRAEGEIVRNPRAGRDGGGFVPQVSAAAHPCRKRGVMDGHPATSRHFSTRPARLLNSSFTAISSGTRICAEVVRGLVGL